ncbi:3472_t:CDS:1 [Scutellospora calospora]|uniref:3472_t:CDS:1 n=1 Tax=Scutellospora calospora TaxID=85575 RepID=A0ACA9L7T0_9GLOM|nr:3472_t:CDS:1 [Scutellospora calospora]
MDKAAKRKYCSMMMFDVPLPSFSKSNDKSDSSNQLTIDYTTSLENSAIRTQDNFIFTSFLEPIKVKPQRFHKNTRINLLEQDSSKSNEILNEPRSQETRIRRPPNSFLLYRQARQSEVTRLYGNISNSEISKILSNLWQSESEEVKHYWQKIADLKKLEHMETYPEYVYNSKSGTKPTKKRKLKATDSNNFQNSLPIMQTSHADQPSFFSESMITVDSNSIPWFYNQFENQNQILPSIFPKDDCDYNVINAHKVLNSEQQSQIEATASMSYPYYDNTYPYYDF